MPGLCTIATAGAAGAGVTVTGLSVRATRLECTCALAVREEWCLYRAAMCGAIEEADLWVKQCFGVARGGVCFS